MAVLSDPEKWKQWYPGADTASLLIIEGKPKGISTGDRQGIMITQVTDSTILLANAGPASKKGKSGWNLYESGLPNTVTLQWYMDFHLRWYPWEKFSSLLLEKRYGPMMELGLDKLKKVIEQ